ncbi:hypothetical protein H5410_026670 [Solanum commersonii]|uniref:Uncharacterized protein n=1 Tax=Solanum commersonii TaxID=4109 RepID=A0A9J5YXP4_SOLCO|nr:hypothetical protein H5410_026670 [Solanum commersonii]
MKNAIEKMIEVKKKESNYCSLNRIFMLCLLIMYVIV